MKRVSLFFLSVFFITGLFADVVEPGEIERQFKVVNLNEFPDYQFHIMYTGYHYDHGYQRNTPHAIILEQDSVYSTSSREDNSLIYAVNKKNESEEWASDNAVGGGDHVSSDDIYTIIDVVRITRVADQKVEFKIEKEIIVYKDGRTKERKHKGGAGFMPLGGGGSTPGWVYWLLPSVSILAMAAFILWRRKQNRSLPDAGLAV